MWFIYFIFILHTWKGLYWSALTKLSVYFFHGVGANLTYSMYFYTDDERCTVPRLYDFFRPKFKTQICELLGISKKRMKITGCSVADVIGIVMHFYIIDKVGERRNFNIDRQMTDIMDQESFSVQMNKVSGFLSNYLN